MPIYEFSCEACRGEFELLVRSSRWKGATCPKCGSARISKKLSVFASQTASSRASTSPPACSENPRACGRCCAGTPHSH